MLRRVDRRRVQHPHLLEEVLLLRIGSGDGDLLDRDAVIVEDVDDAPVRERGHREPRHLHERLLPLERGGQRLTGLGEEANPLVGRDRASDA